MGLWIMCAADDVDCRQRKRGRWASQRMVLQTIVLPAIECHGKIFIVDDGVANDGAAENRVTENGRCQRWRC